MPAALTRMPAARLSSTAKPPAPDLDRQPQRPPTLQEELELAKRFRAAAEQLTVEQVPLPVADTAESRDFRALLARRASNVKSGAEPRFGQEELRSLFQALRDNTEVPAHLRPVAERLGRHCALPLDGQ
jgi:hypothetical protein